MKESIEALAGNESLASFSLNCTREHFAEKYQVSSERFLSLKIIFMLPWRLPLHNSIKSLSVETEATKNSKVAGAILRSFCNCFIFIATSDENK